jgi:hypothetical protein
MSRNNFTIGAYYTSLVRMDEISNFPYQYALYFSTDHASDAGGIWLYLCNGKPNVADNWISYDQAVAEGKFDYLLKKPTANPIFVDSLQGHQTETPHANIFDGNVYMSYHNNLRRGDWQATMMTTSPDGVNFEKIVNDNGGIILPPVELLNHTGYFRWGENKFHDVAYKYIGYSLRKGTQDYRSAMWASNDAIHWTEVRRFNSWRTDRAIPEDERFLTWHSIDPNAVRRINEDEYVMIAKVGSRAAGDMKRTTELYEFYVAADGCTQTRMARKILSVGGVGEKDIEECASPAITTLNDSIYMVYVGTSGEGKINTVMGAVGTFHKEAELTSPLKSEDRQAHFYLQEEFEKDLQEHRRK